jgi:hypothetical protein
MFVNVLSSWLLLGSGILPLEIFNPDFPRLDFTVVSTWSAVLSGVFIRSILHFTQCARHDV